MEPEKNQQPFQKNPWSHSLGSRRCCQSSPVFPDLSLLEGAAFSLSLLILSVSSPFFPWPSVVTVVEYRSGKDGLFHCLKNNLSLHLHPRMGGITMNSCVNLQGVCLFCSESQFEYQLHILWCVSVFRWTYVPGQWFFKQLWSRGMPSSNRDEQKCLSWSWGLRAHLLEGSSHSSSGPQARLQILSSARLESTVLRRLFKVPWRAGLAGPAHRGRLLGQPRCH